MISHRDKVREGRALLESSANLVECRGVSFGTVRSLLLLRGTTFSLGKNIGLLLSRGAIFSCGGPRLVACCFRKTLGDG